MNQQEKQAAVAQIAQNEMMMQQIQAAYASIIQEEELFWQRFDASRETAEYDCIVDEIQASPTYRLSTLQSIENAQHQGVKVPAKVWRYFLDLGEDVRQMWEEEEESESEAMQQAAQMQMQMQAQIEQIKGQVQMMVQELRNKGLITVALINQEGRSGED